MAAAIAALFRHPIKGFTPEKLKLAQLVAGKAFPGDRLYALEDGPSGFDPAAPKFIPKQRFAVLAKIAEVAKAKTRLDDATGVFHAAAEGRAPFAGDLAEPAARSAFAAWVGDLLGEAAGGPLRLIDGAGHRFLDHPMGHVSIINLASVRDLEAKAGRPIDPLRFRANLYVEGWPAWIESDAKGGEVRLGAVTARVFAPIVRCAATHVDPSTGERDFDLVRALHDNYGHPNCGVYVSVLEGGLVRRDDVAELTRG